jgi:endogenous inhibitor of DNA gyrase (YacG/DUF329 family)
MPQVVRCPHCGKPVTWSDEHRWRPFCSERCKLIDLGQWASEKYRIEAEEQREHDEDGRGKNEAQ